MSYQYLRFDMQSCERKEDATIYFLFLPFLVCFAGENNRGHATVSMRQKHKVPGSNFLQ